MYRIVICLCAALCLWGCEETLVNEDSTPQPVQVVEQPSGVGFGLEALPYTVWQVLRGAGRTTDVWVAGYVVGYVNSSIANAHFDAYGAGETNILLAARADETDRANVLTVQLSSSQARQLFSLAHNPAGLRRAVSLHAASIDKYCYALGLRGVDRGVWIALPQSVNLDCGYEEERDGWGKPDESGSEPDSGGAANVDGVLYYTGTEIFGLYDTEELDNVISIDNSESSGREPSQPCMPRFILSRVGLTEAYETYGWIVGYVCRYDDTNVCVTTVPGSANAQESFIADLDDADMAQWMHETFTEEKRNRLIRICGTLKFKGQRWHVRNIESLDWLRAPTDG